MSRLICWKCRNAFVKWEEGTDTDADDLLTNGILVCEKNCGGRWVGINRLLDLSRHKKEEGMTVYILEIGPRYESRHTIKVFLSEELAMSAIPDGFEERKIGYYYYANNYKTEQWLKITKVEVED